MHPIGGDIMVYNYFYSETCTLKDALCFKSRKHFTSVIATEAERKQSMTQHMDQFTTGFGGGKLGCNFFQNAKPNPDSVVSKLSRATSVAVLGIRRIGKTSFLAESRDRLLGLGKNVIWIDLNTSDTPTKALSAILGAMQQGKNKGIATSLKDWVKKSEFFSDESKSAIGSIVSGAVSNSSAKFDENFIESLYRQTGRLLEALDADNKPIIIFDELTTLIKNTIEQSKYEETRMVVGRLNSFLGLLRSWRKDEIGVRMAVSGSVSFDWLQREYGVRSDSINDCVRVYIEELDRDGAKDLLSMCVGANDIPNWNEKFRDELIDFLPAYYPGLVQLAFEVVSSETNPVENLNESIRDKIDQAFWDNYFVQFDTRFRRYSPSEQRRCIKLFNMLEQQESGKISGDEALNILDGVELPQDEPNGREIISHLRSDSFVDIVSGGIRFSSGLVPAWRNFGRKIQF